MKTKAKNPKRFSEKQAWLFLSREFEAQAKTKKDIPRTRYGLCHAVESLYWQGKVSSRLELKMARVLKEYRISARMNTFFFPTKGFHGDYAPEHSRLRAALCRKFARGCK